MKPPKGLGTRGRRFWRSVFRDFEPSASEAELVAEVCRLLDEIDVLEAGVREQGVTVMGSRNQIRPHPSLSELRQHRLAVGRLVAQLGFPDAKVDSPATTRGRKAAESRWNGHQKRSA